MADNPDIGKLKIDDAVNQNIFTIEEGERYKKSIDDISKLLPTVPTENDKGKRLSDSQRQSILFNMAVKQQYEQKAKTLPEKQAEKATQTATIADKKNSLLLEGLNDNQLTKLKEKTQKSIDAKDENGKPVLNEKEMADTKAELEAIDQIIKEREKEPKGKTIS